MISRVSSVRLFLRKLQPVQFGPRSVASTPTASLSRKRGRLGTFTFVSGSSNDATTPLVVLVGFGGARDDVMAKYSEVYDEDGYARVRFCPGFPKENSLVGYHIHARFLYDRLHKECPQLESRPLIFHLFSMTGVRVFVALWDLIAANSSASRIHKSNVCGLIFDSCPAVVLPPQVGMSLARIVCPLKRYSKLRHYTYFLVATCVLWVHHFRILLETLRDPKARTRHFAFARLREMDDLPKQQLYLYSKKDDLCNPEHTRRFAATQRESGAQVREKCWDESGHCRHAVHYPAEYKSLCVDFARLVFK